MRSIVLAGAALVAVASSVAALQVDARARDVVQSAERAVADDSVATVTARWDAAVQRDSTARAAALGLGTLARLAYDFDAAERLFERVLAKAGSTPDEWGVQARLGLYRVANATGDMPRADSLAELALRDARRIGDRGGEIDALVGLSGTRSAVGPEEPGFATLDTLRRLLPPGDGRDRGEYLCRLGLLLGVSGDSAASSLIRDGLRMAERIGERQLAGHCLEAHALVFSLHGQADSVFPVMDRAEALLRATRAHASLARLYSRRSDELQARGRLGEAKAALAEVLAEGTRSRNRARIANAYGGLGMLALRVGDLATAADWFERAAALNDSLGRGEGALIARENRAEVLAASGDLEAARAAFTGTLAEAEQFGFFEDVVISHQQLARLAIRRSDWSEAERQLAAAASKARARGLDRLAETLVYDRGVLALGRGHLTEAERLFGGFLTRVAPEDRLVRYTVRVRLAEVAARRGDLAGAEREVDAAGGELEQWRESLGDDELRGHAFSATALGEYDPQGPIAGVLAALAAGGRAEAAFALAERRRARLLADRLNQGQALRENVDDASPAHRARPLSAQEIAAALPDSSLAIAEYVAGSEGAPTTVFVLSHAGVAAAVVPGGDTLATAIHRLVALLESGARPTGLARALGEALLDPVTGLLPPGVTRLLVVPDGPLHRLPFDALRLADGRAAVERWAIGLAPSASLAATLWRRRDPGSAPGTPGGVLALGDPAFAVELASSAESGAAETFRSAFAAGGGLPRLEGSGEEARAAARYARGEAVVRLRDEASEAWLKRASLRRFGVIHLATHALVDDRSLARTALALAPGDHDDGFLSPADLAALELDADLVVLSACRTAGGVTVAGEGVQGLTTPLIAAGARSVVATQWRVGDRSTVRLVGDLYDALARGRGVSEALREAKLAAIERGAPPGVWAGFTVVGDPTTRVALARPSRRPIAAAAGVALVVVLLGTAVYGGVRRSRRSGDRGVPPGATAPTHH